MVVAIEKYLKPSFADIKIENKPHTTADNQTESKTEIECGHSYAHRMNDEKRWKKNNVTTSAYQKS